LYCIYSRAKEADKLIDIKVEGVEWRSEPEPKLKPTGKRKRKRI
jgi:hypothetical protein